MFLDNLEPLKKSFYRPKTQYSRLKQILAILEQILLSFTVATRHCSNSLGTVAQLDTVANSVSTVANSDHIFISSNFTLNNSIF